MLRWFRPVARLSGALLLLVPVTGTGVASAAGETAAKPETPSEAETPVFVPVEGLQVPIIESGQMTGRMRLEIILQGASTEELPVLRRDVPKFRERALMAALEHARLHVSPYSAVDAVRLSASLDDALKDPVLKRVLILRVSAEPA